MHLICQNSDLNSLNLTNEPATGLHAAPQVRLQDCPRQAVRGGLREGLQGR